MLLENILFLASPSIDSDQLVVDVLVHDTFLELQLMQNIVCSLDVAKLCTCPEHGYVSDLIGLNRLHVHHVPILDCAWSSLRVRTACHHY